MASPWGRQGAGAPSLRDWSVVNLGLKANGRGW